MAAPVILIEARPRQAGDGMPVPVRLAGGGALLPYRYFGHQWLAGIVGLPTIVTSLEFDGKALGTGAVPAATEIEWAGSNATLAGLAALMWIDAPVTVRIGPEVAEPPVVLAGKVLEATVRDGRLRIALADPAADLRRAIVPGRYAGTGGLEGPAEWAGTMRRRVWGRVWNIPGAPIDKANNLWCFADPLRPIEAITTVRDKGAATAALSVLEWQGSLAATHAALLSAPVPQGGGVACPSLACVKWWTQPAGDLTADVLGEIGSGYVETAAQICERIVGALGEGPGFADGPVFADGAVEAAAALRPAPCGWVIADETTPVSAMLDQLLGDASLLWVLSADGTIDIRAWAWGSPAAAGRAIGVSRLRSFKPVATLRVGYRRNEHPMSRGDLAAIVTERWPDGAPESPMVGSLYYDEANRPWRFEGLGLTFEGEPIGFGEGDGAGPLAGAGYADVQDRQVSDVIAALQAIDDDGVITIDEKIRALIPEASWLERAYQARLAQSDAQGVAIDALTAARADWLAARDALVPAWNDASQASPVLREDWDAVLDAYRRALEDAATVLGGAAAVSVVPPPPQRVQTDVDGEPLAGQLPRVLEPTVRRGGIDIRTAAGVSYAITTIDVTASVVNVAGSPDKGRITVTEGTTGTISLTVTVDEVAHGPFVIPFTEFVAAQDVTEGFAPLASPAFTGDVDTTGEYLKGGVPLGSIFAPLASPEFTGTVSAAAGFAVGGVQVVGARQAAIADHASDATINAILTAMRMHGLIST